jgi:hypothetical protein
LALEPAAAHEQAAAGHFVRSAMFSPAIEQFIAEVHGAGPGIAEYAEHFRNVLERIDREAESPGLCNTHPA